MPFKCPPALYEAAFIIDNLLRTRGVRDRVSIRIVTPEPQPLTILGAEAGKLVSYLLLERGIEYHPSERVKEIRPGNLLTESGRQFSQTLLLAVPVHVAPQVVKRAGLVDESGWVPVDPRTLATTRRNVYAIGDCADARTPKGQLLPRAGTLAEEQGKVVAANIIREMMGDESRAEFQGNGTCFMEVGAGNATPVRASFYSEPVPKWEFTPSVEGFRQKEQFFDDRMKAWFG